MITVYSARGKQWHNLLCLFSFLRFDPTPFGCLHGMAFVAKKLNVLGACLPAFGKWQDVIKFESIGAAALLTPAACPRVDKRKDPPGVILLVTLFGAPGLALILSAVLPRRDRTAATATTQAAIRPPF